MSVRSGPKGCKGKGDIRGYKGCKGPGASVSVDLRGVRGCLGCVGCRYAADLRGCEEVRGVVRGAGASVRSVPKGV